jgi:hypothetical protein
MDALIAELEAALAAETRYQNLVMIVGGLLLAVALPLVTIGSVEPAAIAIALVAMIAVGRVAARRNRPAGEAVIETIRSSPGDVVSIADIFDERQQWRRWRVIRINTVTHRARFRTTEASQLLVALAERCPNATIRFLPVG